VLPETHLYFSGSSGVSISATIKPSLDKIVFASRMKHAAKVHLRPVSSIRSIGLTTTSTYEHLYRWRPKSREVAVYSITSFYTPSTTSRNLSQSAFYLKRVGHFGHKFKVDEMSLVKTLLGPQNYGIRI